jgi:hypothetical protein
MYIRFQRAGGTTSNASASADQMNTHPSLIFL